MSETYYGSNELDPELARGGQGRGALTWRDYVHILVERFWVLATVCAVVMTASVLHTNRKVPMFQAGARIQMDVPQAKAVRDDDMVDVNTRDSTYIATQVKILQSSSLAGLVGVRLFEENRTPGAALSATELGGIVHRAVRAEPVPGTRMVDIVAVHTNPETAAEIANGMAETYIEENLSQRMKYSVEALVWLRRQANEYKTSLDGSELELQKYKEETLGASRVDEQNVVTAKLRDLSSSLTAAETERLSLDTECRKIESRRKTDGDLTQVSVIASDSLVAAAKAELLNKQTEIAVLRGRYREKHPALLLVEQQLAELGVKLDKACQLAAEGVSSRLAMAQSKEDAIRREFSEQQKKAFELDRKLLTYEELLRNVEADQALYNSMLARMKETSVAGKLETNNIRLVDTAAVPGAPFNINRRRETMQAAGLALFLGIGLSFLLHFADDRIRRSEDLEQGVGLPVLAIVPRISGRTETLRARVTQEDRQSAAAEAFRTLRASLVLSPAARKARLLMVTSAHPSAGKSLVSSNLAIVHAHNGIRTLLIDADLRRPSLNRAFNVACDTGLSHVLAGDVPWRDVVIATPIENLDIITVGRIPPNPAELLGSSEMRKLLHEACESYEKVFLDCPPVFGLSDPLVLLPQVDGVLFVVHFNKSRRRAVQQAVQKMRGGQTPIVGAVMNDVNLSRPGGYYYYYHQYSDYYGHYGKRDRKKT